MAGTNGTVDWHCSDTVTLRVGTVDCGFEAKFGTIDSSFGTVAGHTNW